MCVCVRARVCMYTHWIFLTLLMLLVSSLDILDCCGHKRATWGIRNKLRLESAGCSLLNSDWLVRPPLFLCCVGCSTNHLLFPVPGRRGTREEGRGFQRAVPWGVMGQRSRKRIGTLGPLRGWGFFFPLLPSNLCPYSSHDLPCWDTGCQCTYCVDLTCCRNSAEGRAWP